MTRREAFWAIFGLVAVAIIVVLGPRTVRRWKRTSDTSIRDTPGIRAEETSPQDSHTDTANAAIEAAPVLGEYPLFPGEFAIVLDHHLDELLEADLGLPAEPLAGFLGVAAKNIHLSRPLVSRVDLDVVAGVNIDQGEGQSGELAD